MQQVLASSIAPVNDEINLKQLLASLKAYQNGDFNVRMPDDLSGVAGKIADTLNEIIDMSGATVSEFERVADLVGRQGKVDERLSLPALRGDWAKLVTASNALQAGLVTPLNEMVRVISRVAEGDLSQKMEVEVDGLQLKGQFHRSAMTVNQMVERLGTFTSEVRRVVREVATEGVLGGQTQAIGLSGTWRDLIDSVNAMSANLSSQVRNIAQVTTAVANGDLSKKIGVDAQGEFLELKQTINTMVDQLRAFGSEVTRVAREVGMEGKLGGQAFVPGVAGTWKDLTDSVNMMATNLTSQVRNIAEVTTAVANGDLTKQITVDVKGEILELKSTVNRMVDQLNSFAAEVTRVAREVGTEGKLGGQAVVVGASGTWRDLTDNVNFMAANLTNQVRGIARVVTAVANGDLKKKLTVEAKGEIADLADTINEMTGTLAVFADQVSSVARAVGVEGKLGGQVYVPGAAGTWKDLIGNVNGLAANLTSQVRAIAEVATAVTKGDLTRSVQVEASGEVAQLKDNVNEMIHNLRETTRRNADQDWLKSNLAKFTRLLQGQRDLVAVSKVVLSGVAPLINAHHGLFYIMDESLYDNPRLCLLSAYAYNEKVRPEWRVGEGLVGQCAHEKARLFLTNVPTDYSPISSGLGAARPMNIILLPIIFENRVKAVIEMASFSHYSPIHESFLDQLSESIGIVINTIEANMRTEELLKQSQSLAQELQAQQEELRQTNDELEDKATLLEEQKAEVERKNREVEITKRSLEEKADQLSLTSKYKSEFLSSMSHELRTPLNSLLILAQQLADNVEKNLTQKQIDYARTIHGAGRDLLCLINEILDLSKIESGTVTLDDSEMEISSIEDQLERTFRPVADSHGLAFHIDRSPSLPRSMLSDEKRLLQVLKNLLSNAFKFTERGGVSFSMQLASSGWSENFPSLDFAEAVISFVVSDTGIGIPPEKKQLIFEAFQQADTGTSRKFGGTGLGLSISRELASLLGGELCLIQSEPDMGSTFALFIPFRRGKRTLDDAFDRTYQQAVGDAEPADAFNPELDKLSYKVKPSVLRTVMDDRDNLQPDMPLVLIAESDIQVATGLLQAIRAKGLQGIICTKAVDAMDMVARFKPTAITLDTQLSETDAWSLLARIKREPGIRHVPVLIISKEADIARGLRNGALSVLSKPVSTVILDSAIDYLLKYSRREKRDVLVLASDQGRQLAIAGLFTDKDIRLKAAGSVHEAVKELKQKNYDCIIIDVRTANDEASFFLECVADSGKRSLTPLILFGEADRNRQQQDRLRDLLPKVIARQSRSPQSLQEDVALFLHKTPEQRHELSAELLEKLHEGASSLEGRKVLIVDDDVRNIFALASVLERRKMVVLTAETGAAALAILDAETETEADIDLILMDIMMPQMDGYETMRRIRQHDRFQNLPIIALTAKAMHGDREKCIAAGASDYVSKPVDTDQLLSLMRDWICQ